MNIHEAIEHYKSYLVIEKSLSENSIEAYINDVKKFATYCISYQITTPAEITKDIISDFLKNNESTGLTNRTQARTISSIRSFFKFLVYEGQVIDNPTVVLETPKIRRKLPNYLTVEEVDSILRSVELYKPEGLRNRAIINILYSCGLRVSELINLKLSDINFRVSEIEVNSKGNKNRRVPINDKIKQEIKQYINGYRSYLDIMPGYENILFLNRRGSSLSRVMVFNIIKHLVQRAGIKKTVSPHTFRHSYAHELIIKGNSLTTVQNLLGHESILTTEIYMLRK